VQLVSKISNLCDPDPPTLQTDRQTDRQTDGRTDGQTDGQHAISIPRYALVHCAVKSYHGWPIGTHQCSFERYHLRPPTASSSPRFGVRNPHPKFQSLLFQERLQIWLVYSHGSSEQKSVKNCGEKGALAYPGTAQIFWVPLIISRTGKATIFKFCRQIQRIDRNKSPSNISTKVAVGVLRDSRNFQGTIYTAHRAVIFAVAQLSYRTLVLNYYFKNVCPLIRSKTIKLIKTLPFCLR